MTRTQRVTHLFSYCPRLVSAFCKAKRESALPFAVMIVWAGIRKRERGAFPLSRLAHPDCIPQRRPIIASVELFRSRTIKPLAATLILGFLFVHEPDGPYKRHRT